MALKQPESLSDLSSRALGSFIAEQALLVLEKDRPQARNVNNAEDDNNKDLESSIKEFSQHFDTNIPLMMHNLVTYDTLEYMKEKEYHWMWENDLVFDILLRSHVTKFDFSDWPWTSSMFYRILSKLKHLKLLHIDDINDDDDDINDDNLSYVVEGIKAMEKLEKFSFNYCRSIRDIVEVLCDNCPLTSLTLKHNSINDSFVSHLLKLHNLKELKIGGTNISMFGAKQLLLGLPQLKTFQAPKEFSVGSDIVTSLQSVELECPSQQTVENLTLFCPSVINLKVHTDSPLNLLNVANFDYLTTLFITAPYFYLSNIHTILQRRGHQITDLGLSRMHDISLGTLLNIVNTSCPNLKNLCITHVTSDAFIDDDFPTGIQHPFQNLEFVILRSVYNDYTSFFINLLCACVNIRQVYIKPVDELCDEDIDKILSYNPLIHLQELCVWRKLSSQKTPFISCCLHVES